MRKSGILLAVSSLPSKYGIGSFSKEAYEFVDFLKESGQQLWQLLPLGPTGYGDSPYQSFSTFAGNPYFIDLEKLTELGWLTLEECGECDFGQEQQSIDYEKLYFSRAEILQKAYQRSHIEQDTAYQAFCRKNGHWLDDYALYMAVKNAMGGRSWLEWEEGIKMRKPAAMEKYRSQCREDAGFYRFQQYLFWQQWSELKSYANERGIQIVGDIPIYVALDSADTWANPQLFQLDETCTPISVAGCPPDAFSATGQLWGNPLYRWEYHQETEFAWWVQRIAYCYELYDVVRIDHFRGFDEYYSIPYGDPTAEFGCWKKGPGYCIFEAIKRELGEKQVIAEDLGYLTESVIELVQESGYPGMKILQFAFDSREDSDYLPHNYVKNCVVYTGTHDNDTTLGWYEKLDKHDRNFADQYLNIKSMKEVPEVFIRAGMASVADTCIIPMQDYLKLSGEARMNIPSTLGENWKWRMSADWNDRKLAEQIFSMTQLYGRI